MKLLQFFATGSDMRMILAAVDPNNALAYRLMGNFEGEFTPDVIAGSDISDLGLARHDASTTCDHFLVNRRETPFKARHITTSAGIRRTLVDQLENPDTIELSPGGAWGDDVVLAGRVATVSDTAEAKALMRLFTSAITRRFTKIRAFMVGPEAVARFDAGARLTDSARSPRSYDLARL